MRQRRLLPQPNEKHFSYDPNGLFDGFFGGLDSRRISDVLPAIKLLSLCAPVTDSQGLQQRGVSPPGNRQSLRRLEPANRLAAARANHPVDSAGVIAALGKFRLH
jgi:hypothetical protein